VSVTISDFEQGADISVRAVINLEAAGTTGGALLFQATSQEMIEAYSHVP
jgi:Zn-dependent M28 family amino/carboxypeptidase